MARQKGRNPRPADTVMRELGAEAAPWSLEKHLNGCVAGYQSNIGYGPAVYFALEALWGIAHDVEVRARTGALTDDVIDPEWTIDPTTTLGVPWMWIRALAAAWSKYKAEGGSVGIAFGLEGGQGKSPVDKILAQMLDERAIARWIWDRVLSARAEGEKIRIEDAVQEAAEKFDKSDVTIRRAWQRFGQIEKKRTT